ncbi:uncharacterized protein TNCT_497611 [Trichonephila clavata]|uniref:Uncharacterized protein n=1 Tax=Trichonephila clavata TaxID=2740835 RepID=A0A8X6IE90_TRICU|nr:uncharacterized protein TNCT_497611 [Trichonephila clavata]
MVRSQTPLKKDTDDMPDGEEKGPDIIPANIINRAYYTEDPKESSPSGSTITSRRWPETPPQQSIETSLTTSTYRKVHSEGIYKDTAFNRYGKRWKLLSSLKSLTESELFAVWAPCQESH